VLRVSDSRVRSCQSVVDAARDFIRKEEGGSSARRAVRVPAHSSSGRQASTQPEPPRIKSTKPPNAALAAARRVAQQIAAEIKSENLRLEGAKEPAAVDQQGEEHYDHADPLPDVSEDDGWKHIGWEYKHIKGDPQEVEAATASIQKKLLDRLINHSKMLKRTVSGELWHQAGIGTPRENAGVDSPVWKAFTAVGRVFKNFDLERAMSSAYSHAAQVFNMSDHEHCDPNCIHTCHCTIEPIPIPWPPVWVPANQSSVNDTGFDFTVRPEPAAVGTVDKWLSAVPFTVHLYCDHTSWTGPALYDALISVAASATGGRGRGRGAEAAASLPPGTEYVQTGSLLAAVRDQGLPLWGEFGGGSKSSDLRLAPGKIYLASSPGDSITAEIQLTNGLGRQASQEDLVGLTYALAQVLHLSLADVEVASGPMPPPPLPPPAPPAPPAPPQAPPAPAPLTASSTSPASSPSAQATGAPTASTPAAPPVVPLGPLQCDPNAPPPPDREDTAADDEAMDAPGLCLAPCTRTLIHALSTLKPCTRTLIHALSTNPCPLYPQAHALLALATGSLSID
jgi:hypothetical protein